MILPDYFIIAAEVRKNEVQKTNVVVNNDQLLSRCHTEAEKLELENKFHNTAEYLSAFHQELKDEPLLLQDSTTLQSLYKELLILHPDVVPQEEVDTIKATNIAGQASQLISSTQQLVGENIKTLSEVNPDDNNKKKEHNTLQPEDPGRSI